MQNITPFTAFILLISPCVGSFLAVLVDRLPRGQDVARARSACRSCGGALKVRDLVPIVSFARAGGRCRMCGASIAPWLLYIELLALGAAVLAVIAGDGALDVALNVALLWCLIALAATDLIWLRLPDPLTLALAIISFALAALPFGIGLTQAFVGAVLGAGSFAVIRLAYQKLRGREGLGLGDVKLMVGLGALTGPFDLPLLVLIAALGALGLATLERKVAATRALPFGAALCGSAALLWVIWVN